MDSGNRKSRITIPERCHPLAKFLFAEMRRQAVTYDELEHRSGVLRTTFKSYRTNNRPGLETMEAALGALGWSLLPVPRRETLPALLRADLEAIATKYALDELPVLQFIAACSDYGWRMNLENRVEHGSLRPSPITAQALEEAA